MTDHAHAHGAGPAFTLSLLEEDDAGDVLAFERANREFFAAWVGDRGDEWFATFPARHSMLVEENRSGTSLLYLMRDQSGAVIGRVNLLDIDSTTPDLGYRIAESAQGVGIATGAVRRVLADAIGAGVTEVQAMVTPDNIASQAVLDRVGFTWTGEMGEVDVTGRMTPAKVYHLTLG